MTVCAVPQERQTFDLLGVRVDAVTVATAEQRINQWISDRELNYVCVAPVSTIVDCQKDARYRQIVNQAGMVTPDGMPVVWCGRAAGHEKIDRTYGPDLMRHICRNGIARGTRHYLYGGTPETLRVLKEILTDEYLGIQIAGSQSPPFLAVGQEESDNVINQINETRPDILWVGLGSPKQDYWMNLHRDRLNVPVIVGVGAAFDFLAGIKPQAPRWMRKSGLEWLFRLVSEPRRLWKRYLIGNTQFIYWLFKSKFQQKGSHAA